MKKVAVLLGTGSIGQAIVRRVAAEKHIVLADYNEKNAQAAQKNLEDAGFECSSSGGKRRARDERPSTPSLQALSSHRLPTMSFTALARRVTRT